MYDFIVILIQNSIIMSLFILIYTVATRLFLNTYVAKGRYYSWLIIVFGLITPFRPKVNILLQENSWISKIFTVQQVGPATISGNVSSVEKATTNSWHLFLGLLWILGFLLFSLYHLLRHRQFLKFIKRWGKEVDDSKILEILHSIQNDLKISTSLKLVYCSGINSPMMIGFANPVIILPDTNKLINEIPLILKHELIHFKRKDLWYKSLVFFVTAVYWFNPIIYLMAKEISIQCELSCDEAVMKGTSFNLRQQYSIMLISIMKTELSMQSMFTTNFIGNKSNTKCRILSAMNMKKKRVGLITSSLLIVGVMVSCISFTINVETVEAKAINQISFNEYESIPDSVNEIQNVTDSDMVQNKLSDENDSINEKEPSEMNSKYMLVSEGNSKYMLVSEINPKYTLVND